MVYEIDGVPFPKTPSSCQPMSSQVVSEAGRTVGGNALMYKEYIATKLKFTCTWNAMTADEFAKLQAMGYGKNFFKLQYYDSRSKSIKTGTFYGGDITADIKLLDDSLRPSLYTNISWNFIER